MFRNSYDTDNTTWSPEGRIYQSEYACEAVKQGTCAVGIRNKNYVVICGLRRSLGSLAKHNEKIMQINDHAAATFSGITADAKILINSMRVQSMRSEMTYQNSNPSIFSLVHNISCRSQKLTQSSGGRPFGVGLLIASYDDTKQMPVLIETSPTGEYFEYEANAFGSRCQAANTYLDNNLNDFSETNRDELLLHALTALERSLPSDQTLTSSIVHCGIIGVDGFKFVDTVELDTVIQKIPLRETAQAEGTIAE